MRSRSIATVASLVRTTRTSSLTSHTRHRWTSQLPNHPSIINRTPLANPTWRRFVTTQETQSEVEGQMEYASADDTSLNRNTSTTADTHEEADTTEQQPKPGQPPREALMRATKQLPKGHISTVEEITQRLNDWVDSTIMTDVKAKDLSLKFVEAAEDVYVSATSYENSAYSLLVIFDRFDKANALNTKLMIDLTRVFQAINNLPGVAAVSLCSANRSGIKDVQQAKFIFCAGADVVEMSQIDTPDKAEQFIRTISDLCSAIRNLSAPVIAQIDGPCIGAGLEVAAACDIRWATQQATFSMPEVRLGIPSVVEARLLCDIVGWAQARDFMLTARIWTAQEARDAGLVTRIFDSPWNMGAFCKRTMRNMVVIPQAYKSQKKLMRKWEDCSIDEGVEAGVNAFVDVWRNEDTKQRAQTAMKKALMGKPASVKSVKEQKSTEGTKRGEKGLRIKRYVSPDKRIKESTTSNSAEEA